MKISEMIERLEITKAHIGDVECLVEVFIDDVPCMVPVEDFNIEKRDGYGLTVAFLQ